MNMSESCGLGFQETIDIIEALKCMSEKRGGKYYKIKDDRKAKADEIVMEFMSKYRPREGETSEQACAGIRLAFECMERGDYSLESFFADMYYYSDRWCGFRPVLITILWQWLLRK